MKTFTATPKHIPETIVATNKSARMLAIEREAAASHDKWYPSFRGWSADAIYLGDNGAAYCGDHLGVTAKATARDISGQRIMRVSAADVAFWQKHNQAGNLPMCETCKKTWTK